MLTLKTNPQLKTAMSPDAVANSLQAVLNRKDLGFLKLPQNQSLLTDSINLANKIKSEFKHLVLVGIGGSSMGPRALAEISGSNKISFLDNVDSVETESIISQLDLKSTAWIFISKSGSTIEVLWTMELAKQIYQQNNLPFWNQTFYITEKTENPLSQLAKTHNRPCLEIPLDVGGRFSVLSPVGLVVAEFLNFSAKELLAGAQVALNDTKNINIAISQYLSSFERKEDITLFWFYSSRMRWFGCWIQQLWAESLGKSHTLSGKKAPEFSTPVISIGTCDQHSILQQVMEGPKNKFVNIFRFKSVENSKYKITKTDFTETEILKNLNFGELIKAEAIGTEMALEETGLSTLSFELPDLKENSIGYLFMFYQIVVATIGEYSEINAFNQPSVALSKKMTIKILENLPK